MSLRERIKFIIASGFNQYTINAGEMTDEQTGQIIKEIEKRIDSIDECNLDGESKRIVKEMLK